MGKRREIEKVLPCGCKIGKSKGGQWIYDRLCDTHVKEVYDKDGHYSYEKACEQTRKLNIEMERISKIKLRVLNIRLDSLLKMPEGQRSEKAIEKLRKEITELESDG